MKTTTREDYLSKFGTTEEAVDFENGALSIGGEFLSPEAIAVRDGGEPTAAYWDWLVDQLDRS